MMLTSLSAGGRSVFVRGRIGLRERLLCTGEKGNHGRVEG